MKTLICPLIFNVFPVSYYYFWFTVRTVIGGWLVTWPQDLQDTFPVTTYRKTMTHLRHKSKFSQRVVKFSGLMQVYEHMVIRVVICDD